MIFNMTNPNKDTITVHCIVERIADALSALLLRQQSTAAAVEASQQENEETMQLDSGLNKTTSNNHTSYTPSSLLSDLLQASYSKADHEQESAKDQATSRDEFKGDFKSDFKSDYDKQDTDLNKTDDCRDDRPDYLSSNSSSNSRAAEPTERHASPKQSNQMQTDSESAMDLDSSSSKFTAALSSNKAGPLSIVAEMLRSKQGPTANNYKIEDDFYAELPANTPLQELVRCALTKQGYSVEDCSSAKGFIELRNWKPLTLDQISDDSETTILDILGDIAQIATLRVRLSTSRSKSNSDFKDKLLQFLLNQCYGALSNPSISSSPESINSFNIKLLDLINESKNAKAASAKELENSDDKLLEPWYLQQLLSTIGQPSSAQQVQHTPQPASNAGGGGRHSVNSNSSNSSLVNSGSCNNSTPVTSNLELNQTKSQKNSNNNNTITHNSNSPTSGFSSYSNHNSPSQLQSSFNGSANSNHLMGSQNSLLNNPIVNSANNLNTSTNHLSAQSVANASFPNRTRIRTSFDPEHELPKLQRWFQEDQHPTRPKIQEYVRILNNLESRRGRKPLDVNNVVYWFKNARAAAKRNPGARIGLSANSQSPQQQYQQQQQLNGSGQSLNNSSASLNEQLSANELMLAQFNQRQLMNQLQLLNQHHQRSSIADLLSSGAGKNALKSLMFKNAGLMGEDGLMNDEDDDQAMNEFGQKDSDDEDNQNEDTDQTFSNFAQTLDLSVKQQQQQAAVGGNLKRRKLDTSSTFDDCEEQFEKDSTGSASPINQKFNRTSNNSSLNNSNKQRFSLGKQLNSLKQLSHDAHQSPNALRHVMLDENAEDDNQASLVNSDGELDDDQAESDTELDDKDVYYASMLNATMQNAGRNNIGQIAQNLGNNLAAANFLNPNYLQQTMNDLFVNRLIASQSGAAALANNSLLSSAAGLIASSAGLNAANSHPLAALANPASAASGAFGNNANLLMSASPHSPEDGIRRIRRSRTFIDPITEVPKLEQWFSHNTHPNHTQIVCYTDDLNKLPYRQKFPKLEPKNIQFWFKNRRAKFKRVGISNQTGSAVQTNSSSTTTSITSQSNSQSDSPTPPANDSLMCMNGSANGNREFVGRLVH